MRLGVYVGGEGSSSQEAETAASVRGRGVVIVEVDGVLFKRGAFVRGEGGDDLFCEVEDFGTG